MEFALVLVVAIVAAVVLASIAGLAAAHVLIQAAKTGSTRRTDIDGPQRPQTFEGPTDSARWTSLSRTARAASSARLSECSLARMFFRWYFSVIPSRVAISLFPQAVGHQAEDLDLALGQLIGRLGARVAPRAHPARSDNGRRQWQGLASLTTR